MNIKFAKVREVESPKRGHPTDAGIDFFIPRDFNNGIPYTINSGKSILIPSGIKIEIPYGFMGLFLNKSGIASKKKLLIGAQVIDTFYSGEVHINLHNVSDEDITIKSDDKIVQLVIVPVVCATPEECKEEDLYKDMLMNDIRGEGGFGSTNKKG
jgi:dUTP pyrophosphatase